MEHTDTATELAAAWDSVADGWDRHRDHVHGAKAPVTRALLAALDLGPGHRVLELGSGPGDLAAELAALVGPTGEVVATDVAPAMVEVAARKLAATPWAAARVADAAHLADVGSGFDAVVCRMGLMFVDPPEAGFAEAARALRGGGRLAVAVWDGPQHNPWLTAVGMAAMAAGLPVALPIGPGGPFSLADPALLGALASSAGFSDVQVTAVDVTMRFTDAADQVVISGSLAPALAPVLAAASPEQMAQVHRTVDEATAAYATADGLQVPGRALVLAAVKA